MNKFTIYYLGQNTQPKLKKKNFDVKGKKIKLLF